MVNETKDSLTEKERSILEENGISEELFWQRVKTSKWTRERAMTQPKAKRKPITAREHAKMRKNGISVSLFSHRVNRQGWSREKAATRPPNLTLD